MRSAHDVNANTRAENSGNLLPFLLWFIWLFWLFFLAQPVGALLALPSSPRKAIDLVGMALFIGLYLVATWQNAWRLSRPLPLQSSEPAWREWGPLAALFVVAVALALAQGQLALGSMIYVSASLCGRLPARRVAYALIGLTALAVLIGVVTRTPLAAILQLVFIVPAVGVFVFFLDQAIRTNQELRRARQEIARLAVSEERLRFARDLHDLLGHTLSLIALKSELARRLVAVSPEQAAVEIADIETAARQALVEVREAVSGYRQATLQSELSGAQELLAAAGIAYAEAGEPGEALAAPVEATLAWAVREGVTNVFRHSRAKSCDITFERTGATLSVEVRDDGARRSQRSGDEPDRRDGMARGVGLAGLRERALALGGSCEAGPAPGGGWRLAVSVPLSASPASGTSDTAGEARQSAWYA